MTTGGMEGRSCLVTGANRGMGLETCRQLARRGFRVLLTARSERDGEAAAQALAQDELNVVYRRLDVVDTSSIDELAGRLEEEGVTLDVLVNNAAVGMETLNPKIARQTLAVNFFGPMRVTDALLPVMPDGGNIVMVSSGLGALSGAAPSLRDRLTDPLLSREQLTELMNAFVGDVERGRPTRSGWPSSAYGVSKMGLNALVRILARDLAGRRLHVNAVSPGWVRPAPESAESAC